MALNKQGIPQLNTTQINNLSRNVVEGADVFNTDLQETISWVGGEWVIPNSPDKPPKPDTPKHKDNIMSTSVCTATLEEDLLILDSTQSTHDLQPVGATVGLHYYNLATRRNFLDLLAEAELVPLSAGNNVTYNATTNTYRKSNSGNSWNAWFKSEDVVADPASNYAITWEVESITGTIREMGGLDDNPAKNSSYSSGEHMFYQVNGTTVYVYESGQNKGSFPCKLSVGDRLGIKVIEGTVYYITICNNIETVIYTSKSRLTSSMYFKGAFNRGSTSSGRSEMGNVRVHTAIRTEPVSTSIYGHPQEVLSDATMAKLEGIGLLPLEGTTYALLRAKISPTTTFPTGRTYDIIHTYSVSTSQTTLSI